MWKCRSKQDFDIGESWVFNPIAALVIKILFLLLTLAFLGVYLTSILFIDTTATFFYRSDRICLVVETLICALLGILLTIPKIRTSKAAGTLVLIYRISFLVSFTNIFGNITGVDNDNLILSRYWVDRPETTPEQMQLYVNLENIGEWLWVVVLIAGSFFAIVEYHYFPIGRGWLLFWIFYFKLGVLLWNYLRDSIFTTGALTYFRRLGSGSVGFFVLGGLTHIGHSIVQIGLRHDYNKAKKSDIDLYFFVFVKM